MGIIVSDTVVELELISLQEMTQNNWDYQPNVNNLELFENLKKYKCIS